MKEQQQDISRELPLGMQGLWGEDGELKAVSLPEGQSGCGFIPPVLYWRVPEDRWRAGKPEMKLLIEESGDEKELRFPLVGPEGSIIMRDKVVRCMTVNTVAAAFRNAKPIDASALPDSAFKGMLTYPAAAESWPFPEGIFGYGWDGKNIFWRLREEAWQKDSDFIAQMIYEPEDISVPRQPGQSFDDELDISSREGCITLKKRVMFLAVLNRADAQFRCTN